MISSRVVALSPSPRRLMLFAFVSLAAALAGCDKPAPPPPPPVEVVTVKVEPKTVPASVQFVAQVESSHQVEILARVSGFLDRILYKEGEMIKAGQIMFQIDPKPFQAAVAAARGEVENRQAQLWTAKANLDRVKPLAEQDAASKSDLDNAIGDVQSAEAALSSAKANLDKTQLDLGYTTIHAPVSGVAGEAFYREGTYLNAGAASRLSYVAKLDPIWVTFSLSQNQMMQRQQEIAAGQLVRPDNFNYRIEVELSDGSRYPYVGKLNFVSPTFNQETGTFLIRAELANPDGALRPGMFVKATVKGETRPGTIVVPQKAVQQTDTGHVVYLATADGKAEIRPVIVGDWVGDDWIIKQGLKAGEQVVVDGFQRLKAGVPVKAVSAASPAPAAAPAAPAPAAAPAKSPGDKPEPTPAKPAASPAPAAPAPAAAPAKSSVDKPESTPARTAAVVADKPQSAATGQTADKQPVAGRTQLRLGILASRDLARTERFARDLEKQLGQPVVVHTFENEPSLADWFQLYHMLDLAIIPSGARGDLLVGNYQLLQQLEAADNSAPGPERLVARRDLPADTLERLQQLSDHRLPASPARTSSPVALAAQ